MAKGKAKKRAGAPAPVASSDDPPISSPTLSLSRIDGEEGSATRDARDATGGDGRHLHAVAAIESLASVAGTPSAARALNHAADRLREVLTRGKGVDGHEVLEVMVTSLDVRLASRADSSRMCRRRAVFSPRRIVAPRPPPHIPPRSPSPPISPPRPVPSLPQDMCRSVETSSASVPTASALREHASALDASERDRDKYRDMLAESERGAETLLEMNRQLRAELDAERAAPPGATDSDGVLRASLEDARRRLRETEAQLVAVSDGFQLLKREREHAAGVLRSSEGIRAALDEERDAIARLHANVTARQARVASLVAKAASRADAARVEIEAGDAAGDATDDGVRAAAALVLRRLTEDLRVIRAAANETDEGGEGYAAATPNLAVSDVDVAAELVAENASLRRALALAARTGGDGDGGDAEMAAARRESTRREADFAKMRETLARRDSENARLRASLEAATGSAAAAGRLSSSPGSSPGRSARDSHSWRSPPHAAALEPPGPGEQLHAARRLELGAALTLDRLEDLEAELEILREWKDSAEEELRGTHERLAEATEANHHLELRAIAAEAAAERLLRPDPDPDPDVDVDGERAREDRPATSTTAYALSLPPIGEEESLHLLELPGDEDEPAHRNTTVAATTSRRGVGSDASSGSRSGTGSGTGSSSSESDARRTMLEMWTELQRVRGSHETLRARYAQQTRRLRRARETVLALSEGAMDVDVGVSGSLASLSLSLPPPGFADSARSSVVTGELSEDDVDADDWTRAAGHAGHAGHAALSRRSRRSRGASSATEEVEEVEEGMDGEDEVLAEYVTAAPPRGPRGHRATQEALARARVASGHRPDSAPESASATTRGAATRASAAARRLVQTPTTRRPESAPSSREVPPSRATAERPAAHAAAGAHARPPTATPSDRRAGARLSARPPSRAHASRPQTAPSSQHRALRRPRDAHPTARRHVAFLDDVRMRPGSAAAAPSSPSRDDAEPSDVDIRRRRQRPSSAAAAAPSPRARHSRAIDRSWRGGGVNDASEIVDDSEDDSELAANANEDHSDRSDDSDRSDRSDDSDPSYDPEDDRDEDPDYHPAAYASDPSEDESSPDDDDPRAFGGVRGPGPDGRGAFGRRRHRPATAPGLRNAVGSRVGSRAATPAGSPSKPAFRPAGILRRPTTTDAAATLVGAASALAAGAGSGRGSGRGPGRGLGRNGLGPPVRLSARRMRESADRLSRAPARSWEEKKAPSAARRAEAESARRARG